MTVQTGLERGVFEFKAADVSAERREITGYASTFGGGPDLVGDVIEAGAFARTLREKGASGIQVLVGHDTSKLPVGALLEAAEDTVGLRVVARIFKTGPGDDLLATTRELMALNRTMSLSIGYRVRDSRSERQGDRYVRVLSDIDLFEISFTTMPANPEARVESVKAQHDALMAALDEKVEREDAELVQFFEDEARRQERDLREFFDPGVTIRDGLAEIDATIRAENKRWLLNTDVSLLRINEALSGATS